MGDLSSPGATAPRDFKINLDTGELVIENGDLVLVSGVQAIKQSLAIRLRFFLGEWFLDNTAGVDWFSVLGKKFSPEQPAAIARKALLETPGVAAITSLETVFDGRARSLEVQWSVTTDYGQLTGTTKVSAK